MKITLFKQKNKMLPLKCHNFNSMQQLTNRETQFYENCANHKILVVPDALNLAPSAQQLETHHLAVVSQCSMPHFAKNTRHLLSTFH